jgi:hypothetical protein
MEEYYFEMPLSNSLVLCVGAITREEAASTETDFCDGRGHYLYLANASEPQTPIEVLGKLTSAEAAERLGRAMTIRTQ